MTSRRELLKAGLAASALLPFATQADPTAVERDLGVAAPAHLYKVLYDTRFAASVELERLAWEQRMRVVHRVEHAPLAGETAQRLFSWVIAPVRRA